MLFCYVDRILRGDLRLMKTLFGYEEKRVQLTIIVIVAIIIEGGFVVSLVLNKNPNFFGNDIGASL